jgi:hypothetical protein
MLEISTSGLMSGDGKRSEPFRAQPPRPSSTLLIVAAAYYLSPRSPWRPDLTVRASSIRRRIASDRDGLSFCCLAQLSIADLSVTGRRTVRTGSRPVAGRPGLFGVTFSVDVFAMFW